MDISQQVAYAILILFWIFAVTPAFLDDGRTSYKDICIISIGVHLFGVAIGLLASLLIWAVGKV